MKLKTAFSLVLMAAMSSFSYGANILLPATGTVNDGPLGGNWTPSVGTNSDKLAWYVSDGFSTGVSAGAVFDDYSSAGSEFTVTAPISGSVEGSYLNWYLVVHSPLLFPDIDNFSIRLTDSTSANLVTLDLNNAGPVWDVVVNGSNIGSISPDLLYNFYASFGTGTGLSVQVNGIGSLTYNDPSFVTAGKSLGSVQIAVKDGPPAIAGFGDGFITVIPEPSSVMLSALLPAFLVLRRRR